MSHRMIRIANPVLVAAAVAAVVWVSAGDLNPPPGAIGPTQRTPVNASTTPGDADSLFKITMPGSYYLTGNVQGVAAKHGIKIAASGVTLDLMGFDLVGVSGSFGGVYVSVPATDIAVVNGSLRNWAGGVDLTNAYNTRLADLRVSGGTAGGIFAGANAVVTGCVARLNGGIGIHVSNGSITDSAAVSNTGDGIFSGNGTTITNCSVVGNTGNGIRTAIGSTITNCSVVGNTGNGIEAGNGSTITNCSTYQNTGNGISTGQATIVTNCSADYNTLDGIRVSNDCTVRGNTCVFNGLFDGEGAGIHASGTDNRIEGNNCTNNDSGIDVDSTSNFITGNTCRTNTTNWSVVAGNVILVVTATNAGAVSGDSGGVAPGSTDPNANFTY